jgi:Major Facilitator Superfamily
MNRFLVRTPYRKDQKNANLRRPPASLKMGNRPGSGQAERNKWISLLILLVGPFLGVIDFFIANIGIPSIKNSLHAGFSEAELIVAGYGLTYAVCLITGGRLGDIFGRKKVFILGMAGFAATSAFCGGLAMPERWYFGVCCRAALQQSCFLRLSRSFRLISLDRRSVSPSAFTAR